MSTLTTDSPSTPRANRGYSTLPLEPLWNVARAMASMPEGDEGFSTSLGFTAIAFADMIGFNVRAVSRWQKEGTIPWISADEACVALGLLPMLVWGDAWFNVKGDLNDIVNGKYDRAIEKALDQAFGPALDAAIDDVVDDIVAEAELV